MKLYKIKHTYVPEPSKWFLLGGWGCMAIGVGDIGYELYPYFFKSDASINTWDLIVGIFFFLAGYLNIFHRSESLLEIVLKESGIRHEKEGKNKFIPWDNIETVTLDNNHIFIHLDNESKEELDISPLEDKELQTFKEKLQSFTQDNEVKFSSKY